VLNVFLIILPFSFHDDSILTVFCGVLS
jgi:hypothetical protein